MLTILLLLLLLLLLVVVRVTVLFTATVLINAVTVTVFSIIATVIVAVVVAAVIVVAVVVIVVVVMIIITAAVTATLTVAAFAAVTLLYSLYMPRNTSKTHRYFVLVARTLAYTSVRVRFIQRLEKCTMYSTERSRLCSTKLVLLIQAGKTHTHTQSTKHCTNAPAELRPTAGVTSAGESPAGGHRSFHAERCTLVAAL
jgi:hypothetical protein